MRDKTQYGKLLRTAYNSGFTGLEQWRPIYQQQKQNGHVYWSYDHQGRSWIEDKSDIMNILIKLNGYTSYLEIGGQPFAGKNSTYHKVLCKIKDSVDLEGDSFDNSTLPPGHKHYAMSSDDFFNQLSNDTKYDIIFIDAWHEHQQVLRDISNSLNFLSENGIIVLHDMVPLTRDLEKDFKRTGTCWRAFADLRKNKNLKMNTLVPPWGTEDCLGFISLGTQTIFEKDVIYDYEFLLENIEDLMSLIDLDSFYKEYIYR